MPCCRARRQAGRSRLSKPSDAGKTVYMPDVFDPNLTMLGAETTLANHIEGNSNEHSFVIGAPGGPYTTIATTVSEEEMGGARGHFDYLAGASEDDSRMVLASTDHTLAPGVTSTVAQAHDLYEWSRASGTLQPVNVTSAGSLVNTCGAALGNDLAVADRGVSSDMDNPMSSDGSKIFFSAPDRSLGQNSNTQSSEVSCNEPTRLYMRVDGSETVEISAPQTRVTDPTGYHEALFLAATPDGSRVWFRSSTELTADDTGHASELYEYNTITRRLVRITRGESGTAEGNAEILGSQISFAEDGSTVYFEARGKLTASAPASLSGSSGEYDIYRYDTESGAIHYIATAKGAAQGQVTLAASADGSALAFEAEEVSGPHGVLYAGDLSQVYRYDAAEESSTCVSCRPDGEPSFGRSFMTGPSRNIGSETTFFNAIDGRGHPVSDEGRYVFFESNDAIVPQDPTENSEDITLTAALDVYEWESDGTGSAQTPRGV